MLQDEWLCVSRLPLDISHEEFLELLQDFGSVKQHFLVHSETTGKNLKFVLLVFTFERQGKKI